MTSVLASYRPEIVFHLAAHADAAESPAQMEEALAVNTLGTARLLEACRAAGTRRVVYACSSKVYGNHPLPNRVSSPADPISSYAIAKQAGWQMCKLYARLTGIEVAAVRPSFVYGPRQNWNLVRYVEDCARRGVPVRLQGGRQTRDPLYVSDAVAALAAAGVSAKAPGLAIPAGGGTEWTVRGMTQQILDLLGSGVGIEEEAVTMRPAEIWRMYTDNNEARLLLDWTPRYSFGDGLARFLQPISPARTIAMIA
jgi:UDP-glucose 4-epimerase